MFKVQKQCCSVLYTSFRSTNRLKHNYARLSFSEFGIRQDDKPPLLILHGLLGSKRNWQAIAKRLAVDKRHVLTIDVRNHGDSEHVPEMTYSAMSDDIWWLIEEEGLEEVDLLGHSMGGKIAMHFALTQPSLVRRLVVEDVSPGVSREALRSFPGYFAAMTTVNFDQSIPTMAEVRKDVDKQIRTAFPNDGLRSFILTNIHAREGVYGWRVNLPVILANLEAIASWPDGLETSFEKPTLFIAGGLSDRVTEEGHAKRLCLFPNSHEVVIEGAGHWVHSEKPEQFLKVLKTFLDSDS